MPQFVKFSKTDMPRTQVVHYPLSSTATLFPALHHRAAAPAGGPFLARAAKLVTLDNSVPPMGPAPPQHAVYAYCPAPGMYPMPQYPAYSYFPSGMPSSAAMASGAAQYAVSMAPAPASYDMVYAPQYAPPPYPAYTMMPTFTLAQPQWRAVDPSCAPQTMMPCAAGGVDVLVGGSE